MRYSIVKLVTIVTVIININLVEGKKFTRCGLADELSQKKFERSFIGNWVCLIESESGKDTATVTEKANGSKNFGLFQINDREWCKQGSPGGKCNIKCEDLLDDDIADDSVCAKKIQAEKGFKAWDGWVRSCHGRTLPLPCW